MPSTSDSSLLDARGLAQGNPAVPGEGQRRWRAVLPWVISAVLLAYPLATNDLAQVQAAFGAANIPYYALLLTLFAVLTLLVDACFMTLSFRWLAGVGTFAGLLRARGASYLLTVVSAFVGLGGLVVYVNRRYGVSYRRGSGIMLNELLHELGALGTLAVLCAALVERASPSIAHQVEVARHFGIGAMIFFAACFLLSRFNLASEGLEKHKRLLSVFNDQSVGQFFALYAIKLVQNVVHGIFVVFALGCFGIQAPKLVGFALSQIVRTVRGLPISAFGIGVDQISFPALFGPWDQTGGQVLAFSIAYTFSMLLARGLLGLCFIRSALHALKGASS